jgi:hypothetical protein
MSNISVWDIVGGILASLGGGALIVAALFKWLGEVMAKRILQKEQNAVLIQIEGLKQELALTRLSYEHHVQDIVEYYAMFYKHYQACAAVVNADAHYFRDTDTTINTKDDYLAHRDEFADEWNKRQGLVRLILPSPMVLIHSQIISALNKFKGKVEFFDTAKPETRAALVEAFNNIQSLKEQLERGLRDHLRVDKLQQS